MKPKPQSEAPISEAGEPAADTAGDLDIFARLLLAGHARDAEQLLGDTGLADVVSQAFAFLADQREPGPKLAIRAAADARDPSRRFSVLYILNDDMPFLVDSVMGEINARGLSAHLVLHPILRVHRRADGRLDAILPGRDRERDGERPESFILVVLDALADETGSDLVGTLREILDEVRAAVSDWPAMIARLDAAIAALEENPAAVPHELNAETIAFCRWLRDGEFTFLGMREYRLVGEPETADLEVIPNTGLGLLRNPDATVLRRGGQRVHMTPEVRRFFFATQPIIITKSNTVSRIHRRVHMDYIGLKTYADDGVLTGELRIVGLFTSRAYTEPPQQIPFLRLKVDTVVREAGFPPASHDGKALIHVLETFPRDELFQIGVRQLETWAHQILDLEVRPRTLVLARTDRFDRFVSLLVYLPRDRFSTAVRERVGQLLAEAYDGRVSAFTPSFTAAPLVRVHYIIGRSGTGPTPDVSQAELEERINRAIRTWDDELAEALARTPATELLQRKYRDAFSAGYAEMFPVSRALEDIRRIERLGPERPVAIDFYSEAGQKPSGARVAVYRFDEPIPLSERVPVLENLGFRVIDERSYRVHPTGAEGRRQVALHDMVLEEAHGLPVDLKAHGERLEEAFLAVFRGDTDNDSFNRLVLAAGADWREVAVVRAYAAYLRQIRSPFGPRYIAETLERHGGLAANLIELFRTRFDPALDDQERETRERTLRQRFESALDKVASLDEDRILRQMLNVVMATVRTSFFCDGQSGGRLPIAFKIASREVEGLPAPRPFREIWVYSPRLEGVHLRFAPIARGGLRWSDRPQDFRTEVLGLAKAQQVKNSVIVPAGAKGGFVPKLLPRGGPREVQAEGEAAYRLFVSSLLKVTDNLVDGAVVPPDRVVRRDGDDAYLVVAADKGTASFSDLANSIAAEHDFWLGDAFASGGSAGYDHKKMGITARGAWECVKRHFREMDRDIDSEPFSVVGVGDMSGDVFGNGMLLSRQTRLIAAFDHRDIFIDPDPDPAESFAERRRLFELPRSSWQSYDKAKISKGGGVYSRSAKSISLSEEARAALGIDAETLTPADLIRAILAAPADLLWFGGIGTYVRATHETDDQAGDRANDSVRVAASELRAKVVGEGANLAMTQRARIEFAHRGGRLNTDFIDNSAGVNSSDQEVNIKIALQPAVRSGRLDKAARNGLLTEMTEDVARACLANNYGQSLALSLAERDSSSEIDSYATLMQRLGAKGLVESRLEALPDAAELATRKATGSGLTRPELAVLLSSAKIELKSELLDSGVPGLEELRDILLGYFPSAMGQRFEADILAHPLRREIVATELTSEIVNRCGPAFAADLLELTGCNTEGVALAYVAASRSFGFPRLWSEIDALDNRVPGRVQMALYGAAQVALRSRVSWLARDGITSDDLADAIARHEATWRRLSSAMPDILTAPRAEQWSAYVASLSDTAVPPALTRSLASLEALDEGLDIAAVAHTLGLDDPVPSAEAFFGVSDRLGLSFLRSAARGVETSDRFDRTAIEDAVATIAAGQRKLTGDLLTASAPPEGPGLDAWLEKKGAQAGQARRRLAEIASQGELTVSRLTVAAKLVRELADL